MSAPISDALRAAWRSTRYEVALPEGWLALEVELASPGFDRFLEARGVWTWAFVTAWNPRGRRIGDEENRARQAELRAALTHAGRVLLEGRGVAADGSWLEESLAVIDMEPEAACALGAQWQQLGVLVGRRGGCPTLLDVDAWRAGVPLEQCRLSP